MSLIDPLHAIAQNYPFPVLIAGFCALIWSADRFVNAAAAAAKNLGVSTIIIGLTFVAVGTSAPEIMVGIQACLEGAGEIAIGNAIAASVNRLAGSEAESRVIVLLTDGVSNAGEIHPLTAAGIAKARGIRVYTVGAGSEQGGRMVTRGPDGSLQVRMAPGIDEEMLRRVADATGGRYFRARDTDGLRAVYEEIDALERTELTAPAWTSWSDDGPRLAGWAAVLLFFAVTLRSTALRTAP